MVFDSYGGKWLLIQGLTSLNLTVFLTTSLMISPYWESINSFLASATGLTVNYVLGLVFLSFIPVVFSLAGFFLGVREMFLNRFYRLRKRILMPSILFAIVFDLLLALLVLLWGADGAIVFNALEYQSPFIFICLNIGILFLLRAILPSAFELIAGLRSIGIDTFRRELALLSLISLISIGTIAAPFLTVPSNAYSASIPAKPLLVAHRCGGNLGPENTIAAASAALDNGIVGIEIDVQISSDGVPFLMHDDTLERTTNVEDIYPSRASDPAETFTISELQTLDAGSWFYTNDPFGVIQTGYIDAATANSYVNEKIPTLENATDFAAAHDLILDVDFKYPSTSHPYYYEFVNICLAVVADAGIDESVWVTSRDIVWLETTLHTYPDMVTAQTFDTLSMDDIQLFMTREYDMINTRNSLDNGIYHILQSEGIIVNAWTVNTEFRFSQLWCLGVDYVTTDIPHLLNSVSFPVWSVPLIAYQAAWSAYLILLVAVIFLKSRDIPNQNIIEPSSNY